MRPSQWTRETPRKLVPVVLLTLATTTVYPASPSARPNVIVVLTDDQGSGDFGVHGNPHVRTPHLDRFAEEGVRLTRFYSSSVCAPTRASLNDRALLLSQWRHSHLRGAATMAGDNVTVAETLKVAGYVTGIFGKWHLGDNYPMRPQDQGFDEVLVHKSGGSGQSPDKGNKYMDLLVGSRTGARSRRSGVTGLHPFGCEVGSYSVRSSRFQSPPHQTERADFPHSAFLTASHHGL